MSSVMIDRWSIENVIEYLGGDVNKYKILGKNSWIDKYDRHPTAFMRCWDNFITALIL